MRTKELWFAPFNYVNIAEGIFAPLRPNTWFVAIGVPAANSPYVNNAANHESAPEPIFPRRLPSHKKGDNSPKLAPIV